MTVFDPEHIDNVHGCTSVADGFTFNETKY